MIAITPLKIRSIYMCTIPPYSMSSKKLVFYSYRRESAGFANAARTAWKLTVISAIVKAPAMAPKNTTELSVVL